MDQQEVWTLFAERFAHLSAEEEYKLRHPDYTLEMPQSGERIRGRDAMRAMQEAYPVPPTGLALRRVVGAGDTWVVEGSGDWSGRMYYVVNIVEFRGDRILRETRYYTDAFDAPEWRSEFTEPIST